jgi:hypothetical protein
MLAATHRDLPAAIRGGTFREDLYYRLREVTLRVPPLRERMEDLPLLVEHCRRRFNARYGLAIDGVTREAMRELEAHTWPGNVRELEAVLREAMVLKGRGWLGPDELDLGESETRSHGTEFAGAREGVRQRRETALRLAADPGGVRSGQVAVRSDLRPPRATTTTPINLAGAADRLLGRQAAAGPRPPATPPLTAGAVCRQLTRDVPGETTAGCRGDMEPIKGKTKHGELTLDELASLAPGMSELMVALGHRFQTMYHACRGGNWLLGAYQCRAIGTLFNRSRLTRPKYRAAVDEFQTRFIAPIEAAIRKQSWTDFARAADQAIQATDDYHKQWGYEYIRYRVSDDATATYRLSSAPSAGSTETT